MLLAWHGPDTRNDSVATIAADVFSKILSLNSSKWQQSLVNKGLASNVDVGYQTSKYTGPSYIVVTPIAGKMKECYEEVMKQVKQWGTPGYFTAEELNRAKAALKRQQIRANEKPSALSMTLTYNWTSTSLEYFTDYFDAMDKVTTKDITNYVNRYITGKPYVAGMIINAEMNQQYKPGEYFKN
jgi:zinc protease